MFAIFAHFEAIQLLRSRGMIDDPARSWNKPNFTGQMCAYCGTAKLKLHPQSTVPELCSQLETDPDVRKQLFAYVGGVIAHYQTGAVSSHGFQPPKEGISRENSEEVANGVEGVWKLRESYKEKFGSPSTNKLGHREDTIRWKDGQMRCLVWEMASASKCAATF